MVFKNDNLTGLTKSLRFIIEASVIAALYAALTILFAPISYGMLQVRISEALTVLPFFTPAAIPGLFIGCIISNIIGGNGIYDIIFGSLATLVAAILSYKIKKPYLVPLPPIIVNAIVVGFILFYVLNMPLYATMVWVAIGETIACYGLGYPLIKQLEKYKDKIFITKF
ncbi:MAG TPA: QueT transporter family protein [Clostridiaceae bacterium]|nr:QueT transporter family protein [Clostridiaceae bacterium]